MPVNKRWLERNFMSQFGRTVHDEISRARIDTAKRLLRESEFSLDEIAFRCGFAESKRFYVVFREQTGTTPAAMTTFFPTFADGDTTAAGCTAVSNSNPFSASSAA